MADGTKRRRWVAPTVTVIALLVIWQGVCSLGLVPGFLLPSPLQVLQALVADGPVLLGHGVTTLVEALVGLGAGVLVGFGLALAMERFPVVDRALSPLVTISQTIPTVAIAPLLVLWLGYGMLPKILLVALTTFFPVCVGLAGGFKGVDHDYVDLMETLGASRWQVFRYVKLPAAMDGFFSGLRIAATYAVVGAVVAEWLGGFDGLGVYMTRVRKSYAYDQMFAVILIISALSLALMGAVNLLERLATPWRHLDRKDDNDG